MPTGYTAAIIDKGIGTREFAIDCLRAMGVAIEMRDDPGDRQVPRQFPFVPEDNYHYKALQGAKADLKKWQKTSLADRIALMRDSLDAEVRSFEDHIARQAEGNARLARILANLTAWRVPDDLKNYREFMLDQVRISQDSGTYYETALEKLQGTSIEDHMVEHEQVLRENVEYHKKHLAEDEKRAAERNAWLQTAWEAIDRLPE